MTTRDYAETQHVEKASAAGTCLKTLGRFEGPKSIINHLKEADGCLEEPVKQAQSVL